MDRIDFTAASLLNSPLQKNQRKDAGKTQKGSRKTFFKDIMESYSPQARELGPLEKLTPSDETLTGLLDAVHSAGNDLIDRPFHDEILRYKKAVRSFIYYVVENGLAVEKIHTPYRDHRMLKPYVQIQIIDRKLEELATAILFGQATQLDRVSKLDEIKGLLVDLAVEGEIKERDGSRGRL
jgi:uncharacterized protein YaaR (DUF327 family)